jgi:apolipoprotein N-acyltransferase
MFFAFYFFLYKKQSFFQTGFFIGIFWFWWISLSFRYYNLTLLIPFVILLIGLIYGLIFWAINKIFTFFNGEIFSIKYSQYLWAIFLVFGFDYIKPFTFDWLKPEVLLVAAGLNCDKFTLFLIVFVLILVKILKYKKSFAITIWIWLLMLIIYNNNTHNTTAYLPLKVKLITTYVSQDKKWDKNYIPIEIKNNFKFIKNAIKHHYDVVVLPESAFPIFINRYNKLVNQLKKLSKKIVIITGGLHLKNGKFYNSTYIFENGNMKIIDKHILVPFGEYIPLPFFQKEINEIFFAGANDYSTAKTFGEFSIKNYKFINAICYEATVEDLYKLKPHFIVALSNDAWFMPSIMPSLQQMIIRIYAKRYGKIVYHSINGFRSYVVNGVKRN